ncbi:hypothetical protein FD755_013123 [Muntiacus reevesi]|uniref:DNA-directed RNA polymerase III subunit RPC9 n=1 Tax=Muntiacus reevesi TaxID=9886 RepID=A0A5N3XQ08_MUNRE|nr:hypothetical protein FD755_013123 [Muntiacus reevesi]
MEQGGMKVKDAKESRKNKHKYMSKTPCRHQSPEIVREFLTLQLLNYRLVTAERLTEEQIEALLHTVTSILPAGPKAQQLQNTSDDLAMDKEDPA